MKCVQRYTVKKGMELTLADGRPAIIANDSELTITKDANKGKVIIELHPTEKLP